MKDSEKAPEINVQDTIIHGTTDSGFEYWIDKRVFNDWRFVTLTGKMTKGSEIEQITAVETALKMLFGDAYDTLLNHIAEKNDGFVPSDKIVEEFVQIIKSTKNFPSSPTV